MKYNKEELEQLVKDGMTTKQIADKYGVSKQRIYQVMQKYDVPTLVQTRKRLLRYLTPAHAWLDRKLCSVGMSREDRLLAIQGAVELPTHCPALGIELNYEGTGVEGYSRGENSASMDQILPSKGYELGNVQILSWRANRIKNDATPEELLLLATHMKLVTES